MLFSLPFKCARDDLLQENLCYKILSSFIDRNEVSDVLLLRRNCTPPAGQLQFSSMRLHNGRHAKKTHTRIIGLNRSHRLLLKKIVTRAGSHSVLTD